VKCNPMIVSPVPLNGITLVRFSSGIASFDNFNVEVKDSYDLRAIINTNYTSASDPMQVMCVRQHCMHTVARCTFRNVL